MPIAFVSRLIGFSWNQLVLQLSRLRSVAVWSDHCKILCIVNKQPHQLKVIRKLGNKFQLKLKFSCTNVYSDWNWKYLSWQAASLRMVNGSTLFYSRSKVDRRLEMLRQIKHFDFLWKHLCGNNLSSAWNNSKILIGWERSPKRIEDIKLH